MMPHVFQLTRLDSRHIPNAVVNVTVSEVIDTRPGFFGHSLVTLTWEKHESMLNTYMLLHSYLHT